MKKLPPDFEYHKYGIDVRLANEEDSEFILSLRTDPKQGRFIHATDNDLEKQRQWMRDYKKREAEGRDYYFVYSTDGKPFGVSRLYNIKDDGTYTGGSWVCVPDVKVEQIMLNALANAEIINTYTDLTDNYYDVRKGNHKVLRYHRQVLRAEEIGETEEDILFHSNHQIRVRMIARMKKLLGITE